jgi:hypothetical protein
MCDPSCEEERRVRLRKVERVEASVAEVRPDVIERHDDDHEPA